MVLFMSEDDLYKKAEKRADEKIGFYKHLYSFVGANAFFIVLNLIFSPGNWWFYWITGLWAIGLIFHFLKVFVFPMRIEENRDEMIEKEMEKMRK